MWVLLGSPFVSCHFWRLWVDQEYGDHQVDAFEMQDLGQSLEAYLDELVGGASDRDLTALPFGPARPTSEAPVWPWQPTKECLEHIFSALVPTAPFLLFYYFY
jgi:hypothetical protein